MNITTFVSQLRSELEQIEQDIQRMEQSEPETSEATALSPNQAGRVDDPGTIEPWEESFPV